MGVCQCQYVVVGVWKVWVPAQRWHKGMDRPVSRQMSSPSLAANGSTVCSGADLALMVIRTGVHFAMFRIRRVVEKTLCECDERASWV